MCFLLLPAAGSDDPAREARAGGEEDGAAEAGGGPQDRARQAGGVTARGTQCLVSDSKKGWEGGGYQTHEECKGSWFLTHEGA